MSQEAEFEPGHSKVSAPFLPESIYTSRSGAPCATLTAVPQAEAALVYFCAGESVLECLPQACSDQAASGRNGSQHTAKLGAAGSQGRGDQGPTSCSLTRGDRTRHKAEPAAGTPSSPPCRRGMENIPPGALRTPRARLSCARSARCCSEEKGTPHPHLLPAHSVLPRLRHAVPCTWPCFCQDPLSAERHLHGHAVPCAVLSAAPAGGATARPGRSILLGLSASCCCCCFKGHRSVRPLH